MAHLRPSTMPRFKGTHPYRDAEANVYAACASLPDDWYALYSVHWVDPNRPTVEGECDFVLIGPEIGLVVLEVKGGGVGRDNHGWFSIDRQNRRHHLKDPVQQARTGRFAILSHLRLLGMDLKQTASTHMICLPQVAKASLPLLPEAPLPLIIDSEDMLDFAGTVRKGVEYFNPQRASNHLTNEECHHLANALCPSFTAPTRWSQQLWDARYAMERLTDEQQHLLEATASNRRIALTGPAGSGKTVAVLKFLKSMLEQGQSVLSILPTRLLRSYYIAVLGSEGHTALTFDEVLPELAGEWSCIACEETQDCPEEVLSEILRYRQDKDARLIVVHDSNQKLLRKYPLVPQYSTQLTFRKVLRNTSPIAHLSIRFYLNALVNPQIAGPDGVPVVHIPIQAREETPIRVAEFVTRLVEQDGFAFRDIVVLFGASGGKWIRKGSVTYGGITFRNAAHVWSEGCDDARCVACSGILPFRGMESPVVIMCELDDLLDHELIEGCYVGMSRAQLILAILGSESTLTRIREGDLSPIIAERQRIETKLVGRIRATQKAAALLSEGSLSLGTVTSIDEKCGVFVRIEGTRQDGLIHRSRITQDWNLDLTALFSVGRQITVRIERVDEQTGHIHLSLVENVGPLQVTKQPRDNRPHRR